MFIRKFDYISPLITLYYKGETRHSSLFSGCFSIILTLFTIILSIFLSFDFLFKVNPTSFYFKKQINDIGRINLTYDYFFHYITFLQGYYEKYEEEDFDENAFSIVGINNVSLDDFYLFFDISEYNFSHWKYERCKNLNISLINLNLNISFETNFNKSFCLSKYYDKDKNTILNYNDENFPFPILENNLIHQYMSTYNILIKPCYNHSYNNNSCYSIEKIFTIAFQSEKNYHFNYYANFIDINNYKKPINKQFNRNDYRYNPFFIKQNDINLLQTFIETSDGIIIDNYKTISTCNVNNFNENYIYNYFNEFLEMIQIKMTNTGEVYHREYKKIQDIAGSIDGIIELIIIIIEILNNFFYHDFRLVNDFNEVIGKKVEKIKIVNMNNFSLNNSKVLLNNFISDRKLTNKFSVPITPLKKISTFKSKNKSANFSKLLSNLQNVDSTIVSKYEEFNWIQYMISIFYCGQKKKYNYYKKILFLRKRILSEERMLKNYWKIKKLNQGLLDFKFISENQSISND